MRFAMPESQPVGLDNEATARDQASERSGYRVQPTLSFWACAKQTPTDGLLNECERLLGFARLRLGRLRAELHRRQLIFGGFDAGLGLL